MESIRNDNIRCAQHVKCIDTARGQTEMVGKLQKLEVQEGGQQENQRVNFIVTEDMTLQLP